MRKTVKIKWINDNVKKGLFRQSFLLFTKAYSVAHAQSHFCKTQFFHPVLSYAPAAAQSAH
jgi:hypothetical protein